MNALDAQIAKAQWAGEIAEQTEPRARSIAYDPQRDAIAHSLKTAAVLLSSAYE